MECGEGNGPMDGQGSLLTLVPIGGRKAGGPGGQNRPWERGRQWPAAQKGGSFMQDLVTLGKFFGGMYHLFSGFGGGGAYIGVKRPDHGSSPDSGHFHEVLCCLQWVTDSESNLGEVPIPPRGPIASTVT